MNKLIIRGLKEKVVRNKVDMRKLLRKLDIKFKESGDELWACCPKHDEKTPSWSINNDKSSKKKFGGHHCFGCGFSGDWIGLVQHVKNCKEKEAIQYVKTLFGIGNISEDALYDLAIDERKIHDDEKEEKFNPYEIEMPPEFKRMRLDSKKAQPYWDYILNRGVLKKTVLSQTGMFCYKMPKEKEHRRYMNRIIFPISYNGLYLSFFARSILPDCPKKWRGLYPPNSPIKHIMYGMDDIDRSLDYCITVEGPIDRLRLLSLGYKNILANLGNQVTKQKLEIMKSYKKVYVIPDGDAGGQELENYCKLLKYNCDVYIIDLPDQEDPASARPQDIKKGFIYRRKITEVVKDYKIYIDYDLSERRNK